LLSWNKKGKACVGGGGFEGGGGAGGEKNDPKSLREGHYIEKREEGKPAYVALHRKG